MLHLLQRTISPAVSLEQALKDWFQISCELREAPRRRTTQLEEIEE